MIETKIQNKIENWKYYTSVRILMIKKCHYLKKTDNGQQIFLKGFYDHTIRIIVNN